AGTADGADAPAPRPGGGARLAGPRGRAVRGETPLRPAGRAAARPRHRPPRPQPDLPPPHPLRAGDARRLTAARLARGRPRPRPPPGPGHTPRRLAPPVAPARGLVNVCPHRARLPAAPFFFGKIAISSPGRRDILIHKHSFLPTQETLRCACSATTF